MVRVKTRNIKATKRVKLTPTWQCNKRPISLVVKCIRCNCKLTIKRMGICHHHRSGWLLILVCILTSCKQVCLCMEVLSNGKEIDMLMTHSKIISLEVTRTTKTSLSCRWLQWDWNKFLALRNCLTSSTALHLTTVAPCSQETGWEEILAR